MNESIDNKYMEEAIKIARKGCGWASPNPAVGCVIVNPETKKIIASGHTEPFGGAHAEVVALNRAGDNAGNATAYVTLMPCAHTGKTPPCTDAIIKSGIKRVVVALDDPNPTSMNGKEILEQNGIEVTLGVCKEKAKDDLAGFIKLTKTGKPLITLKYAMTIDGKIATKIGSSSWISNEKIKGGCPAIAFIV